MIMASANHSRFTDHAPHRSYSQGDLRRILPDERIDISLGEVNELLDVFVVTAIKVGWCDPLVVKERLAVGLIGLLAGQLLRQLQKMQSKTRIERFGLRTLERHDGGFTACLC